MVDRTQLADFLRARREALQPEDVGLPRGPRRRTGGLRREEAAALSGMSTDYCGRIEQQRGPTPSEQMLAAIARGLHLSLDERDHLFRLGGHPVPQRIFRDDHLSPGMMRIVDRLEDHPMHARFLTAQLRSAYAAVPTGVSYEKLQLLAAVYISSPS
jgi:transcriptional regulator with XRE-family HTH domain